MMKNTNKPNQKKVNKIANYLAKETGKSEAVILFGLRLFLCTFFGYLLIIAGAMLLGVLKESLIIALTVSVFRVFSGGAHASAQIRCNLMGAIVLVPLGLVAKYYYISNALLNYLILIIAILGLLVTYKYVPADTPGKPIESKMQKAFLRKVSFTLLVIWTLGSLGLNYFYSSILIDTLVSASCLGMLWQVITLTPLGYELVHRLDSILKLITERKICDET